MALMLVVSKLGFVSEEKLSIVLNLVMYVTFVLESLLLLLLIKKDEWVCLQHDQQILCPAL